MTWSPTLFAGKRFAVVGLGRNGLPAARALVAMGAGVTVWDDKSEARASATGLVVAEPVMLKVGPWPMTTNCAFGSSMT